MSAFRKAAFEGSSSEGDMQNPKCQSIAPLATWLHVYSFSPVCRPMTNKYPKYSRHSVRDLGQIATLVELKGGLILRLLKNQINPYFLVYQRWEQIFLCLAFWSAVLPMSFTVTKFTMYPFLENLLKYFLGSSKTIIDVSCRVCWGGDSEGEMQPFVVRGLEVLLDTGWVDEARALCWRWCWASPMLTKRLLLGRKFHELMAEIQ